MARIPPNSVALAGEFAVLSQLTLRGYDASMTLGHTKNIDILVRHPDTGRVTRSRSRQTSRPARAIATRSFLGNSSPIGR